METPSWHATGCCVQEQRVQAQRTEPKQSQISRTMSKIFPIVGAVAIAVILIWTFLAGARSRQLVLLSQPAAPLTIDSNSLDFGTVVATDKFEWILPLTNTSEAPLFVEKMMTSCACSSVSPSQAAIPPGSSVSFTVTLDLLAKWKDVPRYPFAVQFYPVLRARRGLNKPWRLKGRVENLFSFTPAELDFGTDTIVGTTPPPQVATVVPFERGVESLICECVPDNGVASVRRVADGFEVHVMPKAMNSPGDHSFKVLLAVSMGKVNNESRQRPLMVHYGTASLLTHAPSYNHLGMMALGEAKQETFTLRRRDGATFSVGSVVIPSEDVTLVGSDALNHDAAEFRFTVRCTANELGEQRSVARCEVLLGNPQRPTALETLLYDLAVRYHGVKAASEEGRHAIR